VVALTAKWFPDATPTPTTMGRAMWLEKDYWEKMTVAVGNGVAKAFKG